ncbi:alpha/beta fold hydrolase [Sphaerisporangium corydalis]|uniref:Alpha/beta fold hydrolase n=1 Tax=Sphaerisporangium corydalis TaxID=1441875 RepID=A0ABV9ERJ8_9ACTN|nr:alpha/beta hydrolase [Sphaerisporangium corydalis]
MRTSTLDVPGATIYHEVWGSGPALLLIPGGGSDATAYTQVARVLADRYTVVTYDPRGNSRSTVEGPRGVLTIETLAQDARLLLEEVGGEPAYVFGSSSGAQTGLELVTRHPGLVRTLVAHEPPAIRLLPDAGRWDAFLADVQATYRQEGLTPALKKFAEELGQKPQFDSGQELPPEARALIARVMANMEPFFAYDVRSFATYLPDVAALRAAPVVPAGGRESRGQMPYLAVTELAARLGATVEEFPGDHVGYLGHPVEFAERLHEVIAR